MGDHIDFLYLHDDKKLVGEISKQKLKSELDIFCEVSTPALFCLVFTKGKSCAIYIFNCSLIVCLQTHKQAKCQLNKCYKCNKTFLNYTDVIIPKHVLLLSCPNQLACPSKQNIIISLTSYWSTYQRSHNQQNLVYLTLELKPWTFPHASKGNFLARIWLNQGWRR